MAIGLRRVDRHVDAPTAAVWRLLVDLDAGRLIGEAKRPVTDRAPEAVADLKFEHMDMGGRVLYAAAATTLLALLSLLPMKEVRTGFALLAIVAGMYSAGLVAMPMWCSSMVYPSGAALATLAAPSVPPAPPTFSITMAWPPSGLRSASARSRATLSVGPPAANGTMIVIVLPLAG